MSRRTLGGPVLKWAGGKSQLVDRILAKLPETIDTYYEPFVGGAAVFFALAAQRRFRYAVLADSNPELIGVYRALAKDVEGVIRALKRLQAKHCEQEFYRVRDFNPRSETGRAARTIYLNKTGYNGLYRVNRSGKFNVPFGRYKNPNICDEPNLRAAAVTLKNVRIEVADFEQICRRATSRDAVYLDPPYVPLSKTSNFTAYDRNAFGIEDQRRLALVFRDLAGRGVPALLSNSDTPITRELYAEFKFIPIEVARPINSRASGRGPVRELLVTTERAPGRVRAQAAASASSS